MHTGRLTRRAALALGTAPLFTRALFAQELKTIIVGGVTVEDSLPLWYGMTSGMFRRAGLNIDYQRVSSGSAATQGVVGGAYNIGNTNTLSSTLAHVRGVPLTYLTFGGMYVGGTDYITSIVKKDSPLQTAADLRGKIHGTTGVKDLNSLALSAWVDTHGGDSKSIQVVEVPYPAIAAAVEQGRVDIGTLIQPFLGSALAPGKLRVFNNTYAAIAPRFALSSWVAMTPWADANADTIRRYVRVIREANAYVNAHRAETAPLMAQNTGVELDVILKSGRATFSETFAEPSYVQPLIEVAAKYGAIDKRFDAAEQISPTVRGLR
jgi:NitT/TauT family transport system substrate-binding protein